MSGRGLKLAVIGAGVMGRNHARIAASLPGINLLGIVDADPARVNDLPDVLKKIFTTDLPALLPQVDAVVIATPTKTHHELAQLCLAAGKHVLLEKPFTGSSTYAKELIALAKEKELVLNVGFIERYNPAFLRMLKEIKGEKIIGIDIKRFSPFPERIFDTDVVFDMMLHDLDLLPYLIKDEIIDIKAKGEKIRTKMIDRSIVAITYKNGVIARIEANRVFGSKTRNIAVTTDKFLIDTDLLNKKIYIRDFSSPTPTTIPIKAVDQLTEELKAFALCIKSRHPSTAPSAVDSISLAEEVLRLCS
ncbi:MAG: Gfo/Idh/MocA family oxidoreductase [Candidatus Margulisbacteria bacterium]|nr:Gfo/Idh/MocA family oxidoreductase [Candidatus Margulisiibacteriota bacterium]